MRTACTIRNWGGGGPSGSYWLGAFSCWTAPLKGGGEILAQPLEVSVVRPAPVRPPVPLVSSRLSVEYDYAMVHVSVGHVQLTGLFIDDHVSGTAEVGRLVTATVFPLTPDLHKELTLPGELQDLRVALATSA